MYNEKGQGLGSPMCDSRAVPPPRQTTSCLLMELSDAVQGSKEATAHLRHAVYNPIPVNVKECGMAEAPQVLPQNVNDFLVSMIRKIRENNDRVHEISSEIDSCLGEAKLF